jgi:hypothetical protein
MAARKKTTRKKKPSAKQIAARKKFVAMVRAGKFRKGKKAAPKRASKPRKTATRKTVRTRRNVSAKGLLKKAGRAVKSVAKKLTKKNPTVDTATVGNYVVRISKASTGDYYASIQLKGQPAVRYVAGAGLSDYMKSATRYRTIIEAKRAARSHVGKKRNKTIIKAKRVTIINLRGLKKKANPPRRPNITSASDLQYAGTAKATVQDGVKGWSIGGKFFPRSATPKAAKLTADAYLYLKTGDVWKRKAKGNPRRKNIAGYKDESGQFHPIRSGTEQRTTRRGGKRLVKSKKPYKPSRVGEKAAYSKKKAAKRGAATKRQRAATQQRKATTTRLASRSLQRVPKGAYKKRRGNPGAPSLYEDFQGRPSRKDTPLRFADGTPSGLYKLGKLHSIKLSNGAVIKPDGKDVWLCADTNGKLHLGTSATRLVDSPRGALGKVKEVEYVTSKPHLGDTAPTRYYHKLGEETGQKPTLYSDGKGFLVFKGGATYVRSDGIHD